jgi:hypothetical protein
MLVLIFALILACDTQSMQKVGCLAISLLLLRSIFLGSI